MTRQVVIARYQESLDWAEGLPAIVYNKGSDCTTSLLQRHLPNVGRESHTYLWHIVSHYHKLADWTVFCQGNNLDHVGGNAVTALLEVNNADLAGIMLGTKLREWGPDGRLVHLFQYGEWFRAGHILPAKLSLVDWLQTVACLSIPLNGNLSYFPGAVFGVTNDLIRRYPLCFYERLLREVSSHVHPEEAYYMERAWYQLFALVGVKVSLQCVGVPQPGSRFLNAISVADWCKQEAVAV